MNFLKKAIAPLALASGAILALLSTYLKGKGDQKKDSVLEALKHKEKNKPLQSKVTKHYDKKEGLDANEEIKRVNKLAGNHGL